MGVRTVGTERAGAEWAEWVGVERAEAERAERLGNYSVEAEQHEDEARSTARDTAVAAGNCAVSPTQYMADVAGDAEDAVASEPTAETLEAVVAQVGHFPH